MLKEYDFPLSEFDEDKSAVLSPAHEKIPVTIPKNLVFAFLGDFVSEYAEKSGFSACATFETITKKIKIYSSPDGSVGLCEAPLGAPASAQLLDWLIAYGAENIIAVGSCGVLADIPENALLVPEKALRDEGTSYHYKKPSRFVSTDSFMRGKLKSYLAENNFPFEECITWTTDGIFRETEKKVAARRAEGCKCVEMECAALCACAEFRNARFAQLLFTADSLADTENYDERNWGVASFSKALSICLSAIKTV